MINLIKNEITKIFRKKGIYITLIIALLFVLLTNVIYKFMDNLTYNVDLFPDEYKEYLQEELATLNPNSVSDNSLYINDRTELDVIELKEKYGKDSWKAVVIEEKVKLAIQTYNECKYALEKDEESLKTAEEEYQKYLDLLENEDWKYFANQDLALTNMQISLYEGQKKNAQDTMVIKNIDSMLYDLNLQKQVLDWRLEKDISYDSPENSTLETYYESSMAVKEYENSKEEKKHSEKILYQQMLQTANTTKYAIEHDIKTGRGAEANDILEDFFSNYELFIVVIIVMIAGSIVSEEFGKGTIKLLLVKPYSRTKILLAKFITTLLTIVFSFVVIALFQVIIGGLFFGFSSMGVPALSYNFNTNSVMEINIFAYLGILFLHKLPFFILLAVIAFAISTTTTNTPIAIVISLLGCMSGNIINALASNLRLAFMRFSITMNWDFTEYLFGKLPSFEFANFNLSVVMCIIYFVLLIVPTFIVFKKKNIKNI